MRRPDNQPVEAKMRYIVLWALGVPIGALIVLHLLGIL